MDVDTRMWEQHASGPGDRTGLEALPHEEYRFHGLLGPQRLVGSEAEDLDLPSLLAEVEAALAEAPEPVDAIIGSWDFPVSSMVPMLCRSRGLPSAPLEAGTKCEHKNQLGPHCAC